VFVAGTTQSDVNAEATLTAVTAPFGQVGS
jgi:hypothetical protein